jgi:hypothetical protein
MAAPVDAKRELELLEKVEWRILSASSDEAKLQGFLKVYLAPVLVKAGSEHVSVRNKVGRCPSPFCADTSLTANLAGNIHMPDHQQTHQGSEVRYTPAQLNQEMNVD